MTFYAAAFGSVDSHGDIIQKGAFAKTIKENYKRVKYLWNHNSTLLPVGVIQGLEEDDFGLKVTASILETTMGNDLLECYQKRAVTEHSIGFYTINKKSDKEGHRILTEVQLLECSAVLWGSNENTPLVDIKSDELVSLVESIDKRSHKLYKSIAAGNLSEEACQLLALEHAHIHKAMTDLLNSSLTTPPEPEEETTLEAPEPNEVDRKGMALAAFYAAYQNKKYPKN
ncbi:HK97 family phage prohead protease [Hymenobacter canadensis]|uniref:HK97 family phage prohead protease n=1 Tax=Hymenobacter canadensis TaxID=2999067 RepID=A0ABY7LRY8_9BACT|nr:HK97 family phage prohead protease [Hymenobacter canadensis]WBA43174.1 HK97 family phage prohead protease [Hymenobacter canadensis]